MNPTKARTNYAFVVADGEEINKRELVGINYTDGYLYPWADDAELIFAGVADQTLAEGDNIETVAVDISGPILARQSVTSATSIACVGASVYASDETTFDLNATSNTLPVGIVVRYHGTEDCDVLLQTLKEYKDLVLMYSLLGPQ